MKIAIITSGGDAPGMNACIESIVNAAAKNNFQTYGFIAGLKCIYENNYIELKRSNVKNISKLPGSIIKSSRFREEFLKLEVQEHCINNLVSNNFDYLIIIGGNGSLKASEIFSKKIKTLFIPGTIDNDIPGMESIGFDTALNSAMEAIEKIKASAESHDRTFIIEVMGNTSGKIAYHLFLTSIANLCILNEIQQDINQIINNLKKSSSNIIIFSENSGDVMEFKNKLPIEAEVISLKHIQRGGNPSAKDRILGTLYGIAAIDKILKKEQGKTEIKAIEFDTALFNSLS